MKTWLACLFSAWATCTAVAAGTVAWARVDGAIGPATADYLARATEVAGRTDAQCLVVELDTPGGLLESTKAIVQAFYRSPVPVVVYVAPAGANAGSAGCFITLAADVAAMAPNTSIGAAHPVELGGFGSTGSQPDSVMGKKIENFAASYIEAIAQKRHRNADWARSAVVESASVTAEKALELHAIDLVAANRDELLRALDGRVVGERTLHTAGATIEPVEMLLRERVFQLMWRPEVMFVLMLVAIYGIIGELSNPGAILPGVAGGIALVLALYMGSILPISVAGVALIVLAVVLFVVDVYATTHGVLTAGGVVAFFLGALLLFGNSGPAFRLSLMAIIPGTVVTACFFMFVVGAGLKAQQLPRRVGRDALIGRVTAAVTAISPHGGKVFVEGEYWNARSDAPVAAGDVVEVVAVHGLTLTVRPKPSN